MGCPTATEAVSGRRRDMSLSPRRNKLVNGRHRAAGAAAAGGIVDWSLDRGGGERSSPAGGLKLRKALGTF